MADLTIGGVYFNEDLDATFGGNITAATVLNINRAAGSTNDRLTITSADIVTTIERVESTVDAAAGYGRIDFKTNAATGGTAGRGGFKFIDGDGDNILYLENNDSSATFAGNIATTSGKLDITSDGSAANGAEIYLKHANNNTTDTIGTIIFGNNADSTLSTIISETNGANNTSNLKFTTSNAGTLATALTLNADNSATFADVINMPNNKGVTWTGGSVRVESSVLKLVGDSGIQLQDNTTIIGNASPSADSTYDLGTTGERWSTLFVDNITITNDLPGGPYLPISAGSTKPLTGSLYFNNAVRQLLWPHTSGQTNSRSWSFIGEQGTYGKFELRRSDTNDDTPDTTVLSFDHNSNGTFAGDITVSGGDVYTTRVENNNTNGNLSLRAPNGTGEVYLYNGGDKLWTTTGTGPNSQGGIEVYNNILTTYVEALDIYAFRLYARVNNVDLTTTSITLQADGSTPTADTLIFKANSTTQLTISNSSATFAGDINISNGTPVLTLTDTSSSATTTITLDGVNTTIDSNGTDGDIIFKGNDDGSEITALRLDMSDAGWAHFNAGITVGTGTSTFAGNVHLDSDSAQLQLGDDDDMQVYHNGSNGFINNGTGNLYLDVTGSDDMVFRYKSNDVAMTIDGGASSIITSVSLRADSSIVLNGDSNIVLDTSVSSGESSGTIIKAGTHMSALVAGNLYYAANSMGSLQWAGTDADTGTKNMIALSLGTDADVDGMLLNGIYHKASHSFTVGLPIYISTTPMSMTNTAPSGSGDYVRVVGYAIDSNHIYFCPDNTWVEIA